MDARIESKLSLLREGTFEAHVRKTLPEANFREEEAKEVELDALAASPKETVALYGLTLLGSLLPLAVMLGLS